MGGGGDSRGVESFFDGCPDGLQLYRAVEGVVAQIGEADVRVTKSQIVFRRCKGFAYVWRPGQYVTSDVPAVLSISLPEAVKSDRIKSVAHPSKKVWMHHIELRDLAEVDDEVRQWLTEAYENATRPDCGASFWEVRSRGYLGGMTRLDSPIAAATRGPCHPKGDPYIAVEVMQLLRHAAFDR